MRKSAHPGPNLRLKNERELRGWSQKYVADQIGADHYYLSRWERGTASPSPYYRRKLCALFGKDAKELGLIPGDRGEPEDASIANSQIVSAQSLAAPPVPDTIYDPAIPLPPTGAVGLVGRHDMLRRLKQRLCNHSNVVLTALNGLPGVGKTTLAVMLAHDQDVRDHFSDGILWSGLGPHPNVPALLGRWGTLLGLASTEVNSLTSIESWVRALHTLIGDRRMLLVIDDAWEIDDALAFKIGGPHCAYLVTTRFPHIALQFAAEGATLVRELSEDEGVELLARLAPEVVAQDSEAARVLVQSVGGLPLALTIIGKYLRLQSHSGQPRRIRAAIVRLQNVEERLRLIEPQAFLEKSPSLPVETPMTLSAVIEVGDQYLDEQARAGLRALAVFPAKPNSFSEEAALAIAGEPVEVLDRLTDAGMLEGSGPERYTLHQTIADYAKAHMHDTSAYRHMVAYFVHYAEQHERDYEALERDSNNIFAALQVAFDFDLQRELVRGVNAFYQFLETQGLYSQAEEHLKRAHQAALALHDDTALTRVLLNLGKVAGKRTDYKRAETFLHEGLGLARNLEDHELISAYLQALASIAYRQGDYARTVEYAQEGLILARQLGLHERISTLLKSLAAVASDQGNYARAESYLQEGLALARQANYAEGIRLMLTNLGWLAHIQGNYVQAEEYWQEGLALVRRIGHREGISLLLLNLGALAGDQRNYIQAEIYLQEGLTIAREIGQREWISVLLANLGEYAGKQGYYSEAEAYFKEALTLAREIGHRWIIAGILGTWGELQLDQRHFAEAAAAFHEMSGMAANQNQGLTGAALFGLARVAAGQGNTSEARQLGQKSLTIFETTGDHRATEVQRWLYSLPVE